MLQQTVSRLDGLAEQLRQIDSGPQAIILEPVGRNTAPAAAVAAARILEQCSKGEDPVMLVLPADHVIRDAGAFRSAVVQGAELAASGKLVTFGITPSKPHTGYGYIKAASDHGPADVEEFVEKPDASTAAQYVDSGSYYWNSGMFMFRASRYVAELRQHHPGIVKACVAAVASAKPDLDFLRLGKEAFENCPADSIDYAVMEKTSDAMVVPLDADWSDVGSWSSLWEVAEHDDDGNVMVGDVLVEGAENCYLYSSDRLIAAVGLTDSIVVETKDAVLVAPKDRSQDVKKLVDQLKAQGRDETALHREVYRPWGSYDSIDFGDRFQVKRITVKPGAKLSLQMHHHRAEHWIVVTGTARVTRGDDEFLLGENESTYIPMGTVHRLENPGKVPLHLIEVQSGTYLGEDDIVRFDDTYGRADDDDA
jgi:mannose-1-phosphate guanylyltransferase/mannose-6-phosphate isomerase